MTSNNNPIIKALLVLLMLIIGIGFSAMMTIKQSQANEVNKKPPNSAQQQMVYKPKSRLEKKLQRELNMLMPGSKHFNSRFLRHVLLSK